MDKAKLKKYLKSFKNNLPGITFFLSKNGERVYKKDKTDFEGKYVTSQEFVYKLAGDNGDLYVMMIKVLDGAKVESVVIGVYDRMPHMSQTIFSPVSCFRNDKDAFFVKL